MSYDTPTHRYIGGFQKWGHPLYYIMDGFFDGKSIKINGKSEHNMDDDIWGYPHDFENLHIYVENQQF